jgi:ribosomal protein S25
MVTNSNVIPFPLRGERLMSAIRKAIADAGGRPILTSELADALGVSFDVANAALEQLERGGSVSRLEEEVSAGGGAA